MRGFFLARKVAGYGGAAAPPFRQLQRPADDVVLKVLVGHVHLRRADAAAHRDAGGVNRFGIAGDQRMPPVEVLALGEEHIGAGRRQPVDGFEGFRRQAHAIVDLFEPVRIVAAAAGFAVQQPAADVGVEGLRVLPLLRAY